MTCSMTCDKKKKKKTYMSIDTLEIGMTCSISHVTMRWHFWRKCRCKLTFIHSCFWQRHVIIWIWSWMSKETLSNILTILELIKSMGINCGRIASMVVCFSVIGKSSRASWALDANTYLYITKNLLNLFVIYVHVHLFTSLTTFVLLKLNHN